MIAITIRITHFKINNNEPSVKQRALIRSQLDQAAHPLKYQTTKHSLKLSKYDASRQYVSCVFYRINTSNRKFEKSYACLRKQFLDLVSQTFHSSYVCFLQLYQRV